ncbi:MAG: ATP-grasp domain-containing protein [Candidatus Contendobacter sp.]|nr:ATP-grasp domain-containing protein [Candidatus Contendobacter sp.]
MAGLIWIGHRGSDAEILASIAPIHAIICCDWDASLCALSKDISVSSVERASLKRQVWSSASLGSLNQKALRAILERLSPDQPIAIVPYRSTHWIEDTVSSFPYVRLAAARAELVETLDDKVVQRKLFAELGLPTPRWSVVNTGQRAEIGALGNVAFPAVAQLPRGSLGIGTFLVESDYEIQKLNVVPGERLLVSEYLPGLVVNATAVVGRGNIYLGWPSVQLVGLPTCAEGEYPFRYYGNDFGAISYLPPEAINSLFSHIRTLVSGLRTLGFLGIFGTDWIFNDGRWYILELNPRFQGSTLCLTTLEREAGIVPLVIEHLRAFWPESAISETRRRPPTPEPLRGGQIVLYQQHGDWVTIDNLVEGFSRRISADSERWRIIGVPVAGTKVAPGSIVARLYTSGSILGFEP